MHAILSCHIYSTFSLLSNITFFLFSLFFHFQLTIQISFICFSLISMLFFLLFLLWQFPHSWPLFLLYPRSSLCDFPFLPLFSSTILFTVDIQPTPITFNFGHVQVGSFPLPSSRKQWVQSHYLGFTTNFFVFLDKDQSATTILPLSFSLSLILFVVILQHASDGSHLPSSHFW